MTADIVHLKGSLEVIQAITALKITGVEMEEPEPADALSDAVRAPIGPQEIQDILQYLTVAFTTGTAGLAFFKGLIDLLKALGPDKNVHIIDLATGKPRATISSATKPEDLAG